MTAFTRNLGALVLALAVVVGMSTAADATPLTITADVTPALLEVSDTSNLSSNDIETLLGLAFDIDLLYKNESGSGGSEGGSFAGSYSSTFSPGPDEWNDFDVINSPGDGTAGTFITCGDCYLVVKDGNQGDPAQYIYDISAWDGWMPLYGRGFWDGENGSVSNFAIHGRLGTPGGTPGGSGGGIVGGTPGGSGGGITGGTVPEPMTMLLLGLGGATYGLSRRRRNNA